MSRRPVPPPLYDPSTEHDACGVGFVADVGGRSRARVLELALAGLASLGHRGAFAADGASSDGAGVALPLEPELLARLTAGFRAETRAAVGERPAVLQLFLSRGRVSRARAEAVVERALEEAGLASVARRPVPTDPSALGPAAFASRPAFVQWFVPRPAAASGRPISDAAFERRLYLARRRIAGEAGVSGGALADLSVSSGSCRTIVYKGLVAGDRLGRLYPDLASPLPVSFATFHQRYATNTHPTWRLAQPFGRLAHNGEINTVRGNREELRGRTGDPDPRGLLAELARRGPILAAGGSDSASLDEAVDLLVSSGWGTAAALVALVPEAAGLRGEVGAGAAGLARRTTGFLAPWDGPAALVFTDGRSVGALLDRNGLRPLAAATTTSGIVAVASEAGAIPLDPAEIASLGRLGPGELLLAEPARRRVLGDAAARRRIARAGVAAHDRPGSAFRDEPPGSIAALGAPDPSPGRRYLAGLDAERLRLDLRTMALEAHEPLWSMGDDTPTPGHGRVGRRAADHLKQAFAQVTNPPIDPERERLVVDLRVHVGRRAPLAAATTTSGIVAVASEAGAIPLEPAEVASLGRLGPGELLLAEPARRRVLGDAAARRRIARSGVAAHDRPGSAFRDEPPGSIAALGAPDPSPGRRYLAGLDAERLRLDLRTMALEAHEPLWSMGDDTPTPGHGRVGRRAADHLKQAFAQVTNPPIDPERERLVVDLRVHVGRRAPLAGGLPRRAPAVRLARPIVADLDGLVVALRALRAGTVARVDATWDPAAGDDRAGGL
ncbi:MAG TPA: glutamate synthase central domain-containing protein, partial [Candidatus Limnocylindrales bacterium]|nr:glutamate synthase central domain-containing protein [Candidatus Limnocylindrales bacterium]